MTRVEKVSVCTIQCTVGVDFCKWEPRKAIYLQLRAGGEVGVRFMYQ